MYKYEFVRIELKSGFLVDKPKEDYQEIIHSYAKKGWKFKQIFAPASSIKKNKENTKTPIKIQPIIIPPIVKAPEQLGYLHFNDTIVQFIIVEEQNRNARKF